LTEKRKAEKRKPKNSRKDRSKGYGQRDAANALKRFLIGQFIKFFLLIGPSNASKLDFDYSQRQAKYTTYYYCEFRLVSAFPLSTFPLKCEPGLRVRTSNDVF